MSDDQVNLELMPTVRELSVFEALASAGSITAAAEQLHLSQSQLSRILRQLEAKLGCSLFRRSTSGLGFTAAGSLFAGTAAELRAAYAQHMHQFRNELAGEAGELRVAVLPSMAFHFLGGWTESFRRLHPHVTITATDDVSGDALQSVSDGTADLAISASQVEVRDGTRQLLFPEFDSLSFKPIRTEGFAFVSPADAAVPEDLDWRFALEQLTVGFTARSSVDQCLQRISQAENAGYEPVNRTNSPLTIAGLVESGLGFSIVPESNLDFMRIRKLRTTPLHGYRRVVCVAVPTGELSGLAQNFVRVLTTAETPG